MAILNKRNWFSILLPVLMLILVSACAIPWINDTNENIVTSKPPETVVNDLSPFQNIGCIWQSENYAVCPQESVPKKMGCDSLTKPPEYLELLAPDSQFVICSFFPHMQAEADDTDAKGLYDSGCKAQSKERLLVYQNGDYLLIRDLEDLQYNFAPVNSCEKALGYAMAATGFTGRFDLESLKDYRILAEKLEETSVISTTDGYEMVLYSKQLCGCGPHTTSMLKVKVTSSGEIVVLKSIPAFENPEEDTLCVD